MLDFELAEIYGYTTSRFNEQVTNNIDKFDGDDFCFYLSPEEFKDIQSLISKKSTSKRGGRRKPPRAFTESGLYMLMTVLRGELATKQSRALIRIFRAMKDYITETQGLVTQRDALHLSMQISENAATIRDVRSMLDDQQRKLADQQKMLLEHDEKLIAVVEKANNAVQQSELSPVFYQFSLPDDQQDYLLLNGQPAKADEAYIDIYSKATKSIYIIDNYINIKTLRQLQRVKPGIPVTVFSDNISKDLHASDEADFKVEYPHIPVMFKRTGRSMHDRFIILDDGEPTERMWHCGASSKDAAIRLTTAIVEITSDYLKSEMHSLINKLKGNPMLKLK